VRSSASDTGSCSCLVVVASVSARLNAPAGSSRNYSSSSKRATCARCSGRHAAVIVLEVTCLQQQALKQRLSLFNIRVKSKNLK
jgi:hypothetical protein